MAPYSHTPRIQFLVVLNVIKGAAEPPCPRTYRVPLVCRRRALPGPIKIRDDRIRQALRVIREEVTVIGRRHCITTSDDRFQWPSSRFHAARCLGCPVVYHAAILRLAHPPLRQRDPRIVVHTVITVEVETK